MPVAFQFVGGEKLSLQLRAGFAQEQEFCFSFVAYFPFSFTKAFV